MYYFKTMRSKKSRIQLFKKLKLYFKLVQFRVSKFFLQLFKSGFK